MSSLMIRNFMQGRVFRRALLGLMLIIITLIPHVSHAQLQHTTFVPVAPESLSSSFVRCIIKDNRGFMWFGTANGLIRYDGTNVYRYEHIPGDSKSISDNRINAFLEDSNKNLWIGTGQGLMVYNREKDNFVDVDSVPGNTNHLINKYITSLCTDPEGRIWIGTMGNGLNVYDPRTLTFTFLADRISGNKIPPSNYVTSIFLADNTLWAGTKGGIRTYSTQTLSSVPFTVSDSSLKSKEITQVIGDRKGNMWVSTSDRWIMKLSSNGERY